MGWVLHDEELCDWYRSVGVVRAVECGRLRWVMCVAGMGATRNAHRIFARRDMQKAYGDEMWVENFRLIVCTMCDTRYT